jgi:hypothetical protein
MADIDRIPEPLRQDIDTLLSVARAVEGAVADLCALARRVAGEYNPDKHPSLAHPEEPRTLDPELHAASGLDEVQVLLTAIAARAGYEGGDQWPDRFHEYGLSGPGIDQYEPEIVRFNHVLDMLEQDGDIIRIKRWRQEST